MPVTSMKKINNREIQEIQIGIGLAGPTATLYGVSGIVLEEIQERIQAYGNWIDGLRDWKIYIKGI